MRANVIKDCQEITVNAVSFPHQRGTVLYACLPCDTETITGHRADRMVDKIHLISILREHLTGMEDSPRTGCRFPNRADLPIQVVHDPLGRPQLLLGECEGPAISFSEGRGKIWAALCPDTSDIGIDAAGTDEFPEEYPFGRVFHVQELQHALRLTCGDLKKASALLWSIKEAAVKALGCAFHLVDPRQICVYPSAAEKDCGHIFTVCLSGKALVRFGMMAGRSILVRSFFHEKMWLSIALLKQMTAFWDYPVKCKDCEDAEEQASNNINGVMKHAIDGGNREE
jgi:phosphopantetheinyl transferase (holo-ACP synthase)